MVPNLVKIGKLSRLHGVKGAMVLLVSEGKTLKDKREVPFFMEINGVPTPFFTEEIKISGKNFILHFDTVNNTSDANKLLNKEVFVEKKYLAASAKTTDYTGYMLIDREKGKLGVIREITDMPGQKLLTVDMNGKEILLPFAAELVEKADKKTMTIFYNAPEGLIDIYLK